MQECGISVPTFRNGVKSFEPIPTPEIDPSKREAVSLNLRTNKYVLNQVRIAEYLRDKGYRFVGGQSYRFNGMYLDPVSNDALEDEVASATRYVDDAPMISRAVFKDIISYWSRISTPECIIGETNSMEMELNYSGWLVPFQNGIYKVDEDRLVPFTPDVLFTSYVHADYVPNIESEAVEAVYRGIIDDEDTLQFFYLAVGYTLYSDELNPPAIFILQGPGDTGKSAILNVMESLIGSDKVANLSPGKLSEQFGPYRLKGMVANLCDEAGNKPSRYTKVNGDMLKAISAGRPWEVEQKFKDVEQYRNTAKLWFAANSTPDLGDSSSGMMRRVFIIPCLKKQDATARIYDVMTSAEGRSWLAFKALKAFLTFKLSGKCEFEETPFMASQKELLRSMDSVMDYIIENVCSLNDTETIREYFDRKSTVETYSEYRNCAILAGWDNPLKKGVFLSRICTEYKMGVKTLATMDGLKRTTCRGFYKL